MKKIKLGKRQIYEGNLRLINKDNSIKNDILNLTIFSDTYPHILLDKEANTYLQKILKIINGQDIIPVSGYRSMIEQEKIYNDSLKDNGLKFTKKYVALPNASEHETGLAIDLGVKDEDINIINPSFPSRGIALEFKKLAPFYGFILRYTKEKEKITQIAAEEWHFRYVGIPHAEIMQKYNFCLEEYLAYLKKHNIIYQNENYQYEISYLKYQKNLYLNLTNNDFISGNNIDGFIITRRNVIK